MQRTFYIQSVTDSKSRICSIRIRQWVGSRIKTWLLKNKFNPYFLDSATDVESSTSAWSTLRNRHTDPAELVSSCSFCCWGKWWAHTCLSAWILVLPLLSSAAPWRTPRHLYFPGPSLASSMTSSSLGEEGTKEAHETWSGLSHRNTKWIRALSDLDQFVVCR